jgi:hypothetical protein
MAPPAPLRSPFFNYSEACKARWIRRRRASLAPVRAYGVLMGLYEDVAPPCGGLSGASGKSRSACRPRAFASSGERTSVISVAFSQSSQRIARSAPPGCAHAWSFGTGSEDPQAGACKTLLPRDPRRPAFLYVGEPLIASHDSSVPYPDSLTRPGRT